MMPLQGVQLPANQPSDRATCRAPRGCGWLKTGIGLCDMEAPRRHVDVNAVVGGYLRDLAFAQPTQPQMVGYKRAAAAILALDTSLTDLIGRDGQLPKISGIGPGSARVIQEVLETGSSPTVQRAIEMSERRDDIERRRALRRHFLSRAEVLRILQDPNLVDHAGTNIAGTCRCTPSGVTATRH
jgi:hypothetical protein